MSWIDKLLPPSIQHTDPAQRKTVPEGLWIKCPSCEAVLYRNDLESNMHVCPKCDHHMRINARQRLDKLLDLEGRHEIGQEVLPVDALKFRDTKKYPDEYYTEVNIHNKNLAGTIDLLIVDSEGKANLFDYKSITGLLNGTNITKNYTDKWYEQLIQYRKILTNYGITNFGQTRVIPIAVNFSDKITAKEGTDVPSAFSIGTNTYIDIDELSNLNPVPLPEERTGNKSIDSMIDRKDIKFVAKNEREARKKFMEEEMRRDEEMLIKIK